LNHDVARRFITLVDELYDAHVLLYWTAEDHADRLFNDINNNTIRSNTNSIAKASTNLNIAAELRKKNSISNSNSVKNSYSYNNAFSNINKYSNPQSSESIQQKLTLIDAGQEIDFLEGELASIQELGFAFKRCASRYTHINI